MEEMEVEVCSRRELARADWSFVMEQIVTVMAARTRTCKVPYLSRLLCRAREMLCPHTMQRSFCPEWDKKFAYVLIHCVTYCIHAEAWERKIKEIFINDLEQTDPYDGSVGYVVHQILVMQNITEAVVSNDHKKTLHILQRSKLRLPVLNIIDEFGWNLLHHASFHSAMDVMKALVFEGISPSEICHVGQTPVHVAAATLRYEAITAFQSLGILSSSLVLTMTDQRGNSPLQCLLNAIRLGRWNRKLSSQQLLDFILMLTTRPTDLWYFAKKTYSSLHEVLTPFAIIVLHSDAFVAEEILKRVRDSILDHVAIDSDETYAKDNVIRELKIVILALIRRKRSRILSCLIASFGEVLFGIPESIPGKLRTKEDKKSSEQGLHSLSFSTVSSTYDTILFLHQCLFSAAQSNSLRIMSILLTFGALICPQRQQSSITIERTTKEMYHHVISKYFMGELDSMETVEQDKHVNSTPRSVYEELQDYLCTSPFLTIPILRGDSNMLRIIVDHMDNDPVSMLWLFSPIKNLSQGNSYCILNGAVEQFQMWCSNGLERSCKQLIQISYCIFSPIAIACLQNQTYLLKIMLHKHWCSKNTHESSCQNYLYKGVNPLICCILSGSVECMEILLEHFGDVHFAAMCNAKDDLNLLPLYFLLLILRAHLKKRIFLSPVKLSKNCESDSFISGVLHYYTLFFPKHNSTIKMLHMILPHVNFDSLHAWRDESNVNFSQLKFDAKVANMVAFKNKLLDFSNGESLRRTGIATSEDDFFSVVAQECQQWEYLEWCIGTDAFVNSLRALAAVACNYGKQRTILSSVYDEIRRNRQIQNITRSIVLLLKGSGDAMLNFQTDWWKELYGVINGDFNRNQCKVARAMLAMRNQRIPDEIFTRVKDLIESTEKWLAKGNNILPPRKPNSNLDRNCFIALDVMYKWSLVVLKENILLRQGHDERYRQSKDRILLASDIKAIDYILSSLNKCSQSSASSPFMALLGEEYNPVGFDIALCSAGALIKENAAELLVSDISGDVSPLEPSHSGIKSDQYYKEDCENGKRFAVMSRNHRAAINLCDIVSLCDDVMSVLIDDSRIRCSYSIRSSDSSSCRIFHSVPDMCGLTPLLGMCTNGLWLSAQRALCSDYSDLPHEANMFRNTKEYSSDAFFAGGLKRYNYVCDARLSKRIGRETRRFLLDWDLSSVPWQSEYANHCIKSCEPDAYKSDGYRDKIQIIDPLELAVLKWKDEFVIAALKKESFSSRSTHDLALLAYVTGNFSLCVKICLECGDSEISPRLSYLRLPTYYSKSPHLYSTSPEFKDQSCVEEDMTDFMMPVRRFSNNLHNFSVGHSVQHNKSLIEGIFFKKCDRLSLDKIITPLSQRAAAVLVDIAHETLRECIRLKNEYNARIRNTMNEKTSFLQQQQQLAFEQYGFVPIYNGPLSGLCLAHDGRIWLMDGSLIKSTDFFSKVSNLFSALPAPRANFQNNAKLNIASNASGYSIVHSFTNNLNEISHELESLLFEWLAFAQWNEHEAGFKGKCNFFMEDIKGRSPVLLAISRGNITLANFMMSSINGKSLSSECSKLDVKPPIVVSKIEEGLSSRFLERSAEVISNLEYELSNRLQGSYRKNNVSGVLMYSLMVHLDRVEMLWEYLQSKCDIKSLSRLIYNPSGQVVDCFQRAKSVLLHLNVPFSQLQGNDKKKRKEGSLGSKSAEEENVPSSHANRYKDLSPGKLKKLVSWKLAHSLKAIVHDWVKLRVGRDSQYFDDSASSLQRIYSSKMKDVKMQLSRSTNPWREGGSDKKPVNNALTHIESSVLLYHSLDTSLVTYGFSSAQGGQCQNGTLGHESSRGDYNRGSLWSSQFPPLLLAETRHLREKMGPGTGECSAKYMAQILSIYKKNSAAVERAVQCAYAILEFARTLSTARILVSLTQEPSLNTFVHQKEILSTTVYGAVPSSSLPRLQSHSSHSVFSPLLAENEDILENEAPHPVDACRHAINTARQNYLSTKSYISEMVNSVYGEKHNGFDDIDDSELVWKGNAAIEKEFLSHGAASRIKLADHISRNDVKQFLALKSEISPTFANLRRIVVESLQIIAAISSDCEANSSLSEKLDYFASHNAIYDDRALLEGPAKDSSPPLSIEECENLSEAITTVIKSLFIKDISGVKIGIKTTIEDLKNESKSLLPSFSPQLSGSIVERLYHLIISHPTVFCHGASIPAGGRTFSSYQNPIRQEEFVPLSQCPTPDEQNDILKLVEYSENTCRATEENRENILNINNNPTKIEPSKSNGSRTGDDLKACIQALNVGYRFTETVIELVLAIIGLHSMSHIYMLDPYNSIGNKKCSPFISLCYAPLTSNDRLSRMYEIDECFENLTRSGFKLNTEEDISTSLVCDHFKATPVNSFIGYSELQYTIFCAALFGKSNLVMKLLDIENRECYSDMVLFRRHSHLIWYLLLICPPPRSSREALTTNESHLSYSMIIAQLLKNGYGVTGPEKSQLSAMDLASLKQLPEVVNLLFALHEKIGIWKTGSVLKFGAFHFMSLSRKFDSEALEKFLSFQDFNEEQLFLSCVCIESFVPACVNDAELFSNMFKQVCSHVSSYREFNCVDVKKDKAFSVNKRSLFVDDFLSCVDVNPPQILDVSVRLLLSSLTALFYHASESFGVIQQSYCYNSHCPFLKVLDSLSEELGNISIFTLDTQLKTAFKSLSWTNLHFALCGRMECKVRCVFSYSFGSQDSANFSSLFSKFFPVIGLSKQIHGEATCNILHFMCFYSMSESLQLLVNYVGRFANKILTFDEGIFFAPLNNVVSPLDVAFEVGSTQCLEVMLQYFQECALTVHEANSFAWKMINSCFGKGIGGESMLLLLLRFVIEVYNRNENIIELQFAINKPISNDVPLSGVVSHETFLHLAARRGFAEVCDLLIKVGADVSANCPVSGMTVLETSIASGQKKVTRLLGSHCFKENSAASKLAVFFRFMTVRKRSTCIKTANNKFTPE